MKGYIKLLLTITMFLAFAADGLAESRSIVKQGNNPEKASARIQLRVVIPKVLLLQSGNSTTSLDSLAFPTSVTTPTGNGNLVLHGNSGPASIVDDNGTAAGSTYTATSL